ncbi:MAG: hypothetical protein ACYC26_07005 [Phycisphaerales bacterium]
MWTMIGLLVPAWTVAAWAGAILEDDFNRDPATHDGRHFAANDPIPGPWTDSNFIKKLGGGGLAASAAREGVAGLLIPLDGGHGGSAQRVMWKPAEPVKLTSPDVHGFDVKISADYAFPQAGSGIIYAANYITDSPVKSELILFLRNDADGSVAIWPRIKEAESHRVKSFPGTAIARDTWYRVTLTHDAQAGKLRLKLVNLATSQTVAEPEMTGNFAGQDHIRRVDLGKLSFTDGVTGSLSIDNYKLSQESE